MKTCTKCDIEKTMSEFHKRKASLDGLQPICKACDALRGKQYRSLKGHAISTRRKSHYDKNSHIILDRNARYKVENKDRALLLTRAWKRSNPEKVAANNAKRKAAKINATPVWADVSKINEFYFAANFLGMVTGEWYNVDHVVPLQSEIVCGLHCEQNLQVITGRDNMAKRNLFWPDMP